MIFQHPPFCCWYYARGTYLKPDAVLLISLHPFVIKGYPANIRFMPSIFTSITCMEMCPISSVKWSLPTATLGKKNSIPRNLLWHKMSLQSGKTIYNKNAHVNSFYIISPASGKKVWTTMRFSCANALSILSAYISLCIWSLGLMDNTLHQVSILRSQMSEINLIQYF